MQINQNNSKKADQPGVLKKFL